MLRFWIEIRHESGARVSLIKSKSNSKQKSVKQNNPRSQFHECWKKIQSLEKKIAQKKDRKAELLGRFHQEVRPLEEQQYRVIYAQTERLVSFYEKKSLTGWQRQELLEWIMEQFEYLTSHPFRPEGIDADALHARFHKHAMSITSDDELQDRAGGIENARAMMEEMLGINVDLSDEELMECLRNPEKLQAYIEQFHMQEEGEDLFAEDNNVDEPFADDAPWQAETEQTDSVSAVLTQSGIKQLYKKLALALHPDREADELKKEAKSQQMGQLLEAWKNKDVYTLLLLADQHLDDHDSQFTDQHIEGLLPLLEKKERELQWQLHGDSGMAQNIEEAIFNKFNARSKTGIERAFERHLQSLRDDIAIKNGFLKDIRTLKDIKPLLEIRWEQNSFADFAEFPDDFSDFFK